MLKGLLFQSVLLLIIGLSVADIPREPTKPARNEGQGRRRPKIYDLPQSHLANRVPTAKHLPRDFSWANVDGRNFLTPSWNQHIPKYCGGCYLHSTLSALNDRMNIAKNGMGNVVMLSRQTFVNCGPGRHYGNGCDGGGVHEVLGYMVDYGLPDDTCQIWSASNGVCDELGQCANCFPGDNGTSNCWPVKPYTTYSLKGYNLIDVADPRERTQAIMSEIHQRGPVTCGIYTSDVFDFNYFGGVWTQENEEFDHDIEVVGWGTEAGEDYWHIRNSWGTYWGEAGFFRIKRGLERGVVEYDCWFGVVDVSAEDQLYPRGHLAGSMVGLIDRNKMIIGLQKDQPLAEPKPPVSTQILALLDSIPVSESPKTPILWLSFFALVGALGIYGIATTMKGPSRSSYDPINEL